MMEDEAVVRRQWLTRERFLDLLGVTNLLPGPEFERDGDQPRLPARQRHRSVEFRKFLDTIEANVPAAVAVRLILDNYGTHKTR